MKAYLGIDPGLTGALALISDDGYVQVFDTPVAKIGTKRVQVVALMVKTVETLIETYHTLYAAIENVHAMPKQGVTSSFNFGKGVGQWLGILGMAKISYEEVTPQRWQREMMDGMQRDKDASRVRATQLFPHLAIQLSKKAYHGRADALLIAEWCRRSFQGGDNGNYS